MARTATIKAPFRPVPRQTSRRSSNSAAAHASMGARIGWWAVVGVWLFVATALLSFSPGDPPGASVVPHNAPITNWCGIAGAYLAHFLVLYLGSGAWALLIGVGLFVFVAPWKRTFDQLALRGIGLLMVAVAFSGLHVLLMPRVGALPQGGGGLIAIASVAELRERFGGFGTAMWLILASLIGATLAFDRWVVTAPAAVLRATAPVLVGAGSGLLGAMKRRAEARAEAKVRRNDLDDDKRVGPHGDTARGKAGATAKRGAIAEAVKDDEDAPRRRRSAAVVVEAEEEEVDEALEAFDEIEDADDTADNEAESDEQLEDDSDDDEPGAPQVFDPDALREKISKLPVRFANSDRRIATEDDLRDLQSHVDMEGYKFPGLDILEDPEDNYSAKIEAFVREQAGALEEALRVYKIDGEVVGIDSGPVITLYELRLAPGTKVAQLSALSSDLARALKAVNIRIVPNTQGRDTVGVEVPNAVKEKVRLKELMSHSETNGASKQKLPMFLGKDAHGEPLIEDLTSMPHMLIAGTTGSGKSVCINTIIMSFLYTKRPDELKLVLIDPKMVEMSQFRDIPHLMCPVVTEMSKACAILEWAVTKMDERYELLAEAGVRDLAAYNDLPWEELRERMNPQSEQEEARIPRKLPYIVFIIDELADLMMTQKEVEGSIVRIAQKARAVGIHLVLATQRPQANVVTGLIKSNMPGRCCFKVASGMDSRIVMDQKGGELLLGQGDMLFLSPRSHKLIRAQGTLVEDRETRKVVRFLREIAAPSFERKLMQLRGDGEEDDTEKGLENAQKDPLFDKAVEIVLETKRGSVSLLQRRLAIGYSRSSRLIDLMGMAGIIGNHKGTVAREVCITPEEWNAMKAQAEADARAAEAAGASTPAAGSSGAAVQRSLFADEEEAKPKPSAVIEAAPFDATDASSATGEAEVEDEEFDEADEEDESDEEVEEGDEEWDEEEGDEGDGEEWEDDDEEDADAEDSADGGDEEEGDEEAEDDARDEQPSASVTTRSAPAGKPTLG